MLKNKMMLLLPGLVLGVMTLSAAEEKTTGKYSPPNDITVPRVDVGRQEILRECDKLVSAANRLMAGEFYDEAIAKFIEAKKKLNQYASGARFAAKIDFCDRRIEECYMLKASGAMLRADNSAAVGDFEEAIKLCREAQKYCPERRDELAKKIVFYEKRRDAAINRNDASMNKMVPNHDAQQYQQQVLMEQGRTLVRREDYINAKRKFEQILLIDPYSDEAAQALLAVNTLIKGGAKGRAEATSRHLNGQVAWSSVIPIVPDAPVGDPENQIGEAPVIKKDLADEVKRKLSEIKIEAISFEADTPLDKAIDLIRQECQKDGRNIPVIFKKGAPPPAPAKNETAAAKAPDAGGAGEESSEEEEITEEDVEEISHMLKALDFGKASVLELLQLLQERGDLTFKIGEKALFIAAPGVQLEAMQTRIIPADLPPGMTEAQLKDQLTSGGIDFPPGASVKPMAGHVIARNTPEMLKMIEEELQEISNTAQPMVQVMFKFLEVNQNDLDELAFNWQYSRNSEGNRFHIDSNSNELLRHYSVDGDDAFAGSATGGNSKDGTLNFDWSDSNNNLSFSVYALDWADSASVLYSPRVTTISDQTATIDMSEKHYYPEDWEEIDTENNENFYISVSSPQPTLDDEQDLGVKFKLTPKVLGRQIQADVDIPIKQFYNWLIVDTRAELEGEESSSDDDGEYTKKPIFTKRQIKTSVTLKDGETVLIARVTNDVTKSIHDKIPILGDIPLIGRFFQSKYTNSQKLNLLIFMSCRIVKPDGSMMYPDDLLNNGIPHFTQHQ